MDVEFIGMIATREYSEIHPPQGPAIDVDYVRRFAQAHECSGFDQILIGYFGNGPDGFIVASYAAWATERIGLMLAHRPGFVAPTLAARKLATLDHFSGGRLAVHIITGGDDAEQQRDGDFLGHRERYARTSGPPFVRPLASPFHVVARRIRVSGRGFRAAAGTHVTCPCVLISI